MNPTNELRQIFSGQKTQHSFDPASGKIVFRNGFTPKARVFIFIFIGAMIFGMMMLGGYKGETTFVYYSAGVGALIGAVISLLAGRNNTTIDINSGSLKVNNMNIPFSQISSCSFTGSQMDSSGNPRIFTIFVHTNGARIQILTTKDRAVAEAASLWFEKYTVGKNL